LQFAAERGQVEIRFEDLALAPPFFERLGGADLIPFLRDRTPSGLRHERAVELRRHLHRDRRGAAWMSEQRIQRGIAKRDPVHAPVMVEALVLGAHDRLQRRGRDFFERHPIQPAPALLHPHLLDRLPVAVEQHALGRLKSEAHLVEGGEGGACGGNREYRECRECRETTARKHARRREDCRAVKESLFDIHDIHGSYGSTVTASFGSMPNISGAYIASTRVGGNTKRPGLFSRRVYSTLQLPLGTKR